MALLHHGDAAIAGLAWANLAHRFAPSGPDTATVVGCAEQFRRWLRRDLAARADVLAGEWRAALEGWLQRCLDLAPGYTTRSDLPARIRASAVDLRRRLRDQDLRVALDQNSAHVVVDSCPDLFDELVEASLGTVPELRPTAVSALRPLLHSLLGEATCRDHPGSPRTTLLIAGLGSAERTPSCAAFECHVVGPDPVLTPVTPVTPVTFGGPPTGPTQDRTIDVRTAPWAAELDAFLTAVRPGGRPAASESTGLAARPPHAAHAT